MFIDFVLVPKFLLKSFAAINSPPISLLLFKIKLNYLLIVKCKRLKDVFDSELQKLHKEFVMSGILTESEFWATRKVHVKCFLFSPLLLAMI